MSEQRVLVIENPARLYIDAGRLKIERDGFSHVYVSPIDIAVLCLEHHTISVSVAVLRILAEARCAVLVTDARHLPCAMLHPFAATGLDAGRLRQQITLDSSELRAELWKQLIATKLSMQAAALRELGRNGALRLERLAHKCCLVTGVMRRGRGRNTTGLTFFRNHSGAARKVRWIR